jgi:hypothetical protein
MGKNCFQATNQCAAGGTIGINAITPLLDRAYPPSNTSGRPQPGAEAQTDSSELHGVALGDVAGVVGPPPVDPFPLSIDHRHELPDPSGNPSEALPSPPLKVSEAIVFSLAVDSMAAALYVHWRGADSRSFHL